MRTRTRLVRVGVAAVVAVSAATAATVARTTPALAAYYQGDFMVCATNSAPGAPACVTSHGADTVRTSTVSVAGTPVPSSYSVAPLKSAGGSYTVSVSATGLAVSTNYRINLLDPSEYQDALTLGLEFGTQSNLTPTVLSQGGSRSIPFLDQKCLEKTAPRGFALATGTTSAGGGLASTTIDLSGAQGTGPAIICVALLDSSSNVIGGNTAPLTLNA